MKVQEKETGKIYQVNGTYFDKQKCGDGRVYLADLEGRPVADTSLRELMLDYVPLADKVYLFSPIAESKLAGVEIADKDYTEGDKRHFTYDEAMKIQKKLKRTGWRLPTRKEWVLICEEFACGEDGELDAKMLMDKLKLGLNGYVSPWSSLQQVRDVGANGNFWSSAAAGGANARDLYFHPANVYPSDGSNRAYGFSVRLVRDLQKEKQND